jgi:hypothetical protein
MSAFVGSGGSVTREGIDNSYVSRMVNLTTLAPDIVAAILDDAWPKRVFTKLTRHSPQQHARLGQPNPGL